MNSGGGLFSHGNCCAWLSALRVLAVDAPGNRRVVTREFNRCAPPVIAPVFTG